MNAEHAFDLVERGIWVTSGGHTLRNLNGYGQYCSYGELPGCVRSGTKITLEEMRSIRAIGWKVSSVYDGSEKSMEMKLTWNFHLDEFLVSQTAARAGIEFPEPPEFIVNNLTRLCSTVLEPLRATLGGPVIVTSGWRTKTINDLVGGSPYSQHITGQAADIIIPGVKVEIVVEAIKRNPKFDQCIDEFGRWTHVSIPQEGYEPRLEVLTARKVGGRTQYRKVS